MNGPLVTFHADASAAPAIRLPKGVIVEIGLPGERSLRRLTVLKRWPRNGDSPSRIQLEDEFGVTAFLTDEQIAFLCLQGRFRIVFDRDGEAVAPPPSLLELSEEELGLCRRRRRYVDALLGDPYPGSRSRTVVKEKIDKVQAELGDEAPCYQSVLDWTDIWLERGELFPLECLHFPPNRGNRDSKLNTEVIHEVEVGVRNALATPKGTGAMARGFAAAALKLRLEREGRTTILEHPKLALALLGQDTGDKALKPYTMPSERTFQIRMSSENRYLADALRFGEAKAGKMHGRSYERRLPELPLSEVECDHTPCDILVVDEERNILFGRPDLIGFRCRATGAILGMSIGFEAPSYASFVSGLRHMMYPKDMSEYPGLRAWPMFGRPTRLYVDNAFHFTGKSIAETSAVLGFEIREFKPGEPSLKGAMERLLGIVNARIHRRPGSTFSNIEQRKKYEDVTGKPIVTLSELRGFITYWVTQEHHPEAHQGLGFMRNLKGIPEVLWREKVGKVDIALLPREETFIALAGTSHRAAINSKGIRWDYIQYQCDELSAITEHPEHKVGRTRKDWAGVEHQGIKYLIRRDPFDIGHVYVSNPYDRGRVIKVPATRQDYAKGLTEHQHAVIKANADKDLETAEDPVDVLMRRRTEVEQYVEMLMSDRKLARTHKLLARFLETGRRKHVRAMGSGTTTSEALSRAALDPIEPTSILPAVNGTRDTNIVTPPGPAPDGAEYDTFGFEDGLPVRADRGAGPAAAADARRDRVAQPPPPEEDEVFTPEDRARLREEQGWGTPDGGRSGSKPADDPEPTRAETPAPVDEAPPSAPPPVAESTRPRAQVDFFASLRAAQDARKAQVAGGKPQSDPSPDDE